MKPTSEDPIPLSEYLNTQRNNNAPCWCEDAPAEVVAQVDAILATGNSQWSAIQRWVSKRLDRPVTKLSLEKHRDQGHHAG